MTFFPGGSRGFGLKSNCPLRKAYADNFGLDFSELSRFNVKNLGQEYDPVNRWEHLDPMKPIQL